MEDVHKTYSSYVRTWHSLVSRSQTAFLPLFIRGAEIPSPRIKTGKAFWIRLLIALVPTSAWCHANYKQGRSQEFSFTEARLKGKGASNAGGLGGAAPQKLMQYIKVTFSILMNSYDNTMA